MSIQRKVLIGVSVPVVALVLAGTIGARVDGLTDGTLRDLKVFSETLTLVSRQYVEDTEPEQLERGAYQGLAESLGPWCSYYDPTRMNVLLARERTGDIGILLLKQAQQFVAIASVVPGAPADLAGIRRGQYVETIDGLATKDLTLLEAQAMLSGPAGSTVKLGFFRGDEEQEKHEVTEVQRGDVSGLRVVATRVDDTIGVVRVTDVKEGVTPLVASELEKLATGGADKLVLDLRDNVGGSAEEAARLAEALGGSGPLFRRVTKSGTTTFDGKSASKWPGRLVVLVARGTIGEAELVADALRARRGVALVGTRTIGKRTQQDLVRLADGSGLWLDVAEYRRADGSELDEKGLEPDEKLARFDPPKDATKEAVSGDEEDDQVDSQDVEPADDKKPASQPSPSDAKQAPPPRHDRQLERALEILRGAPVAKKA
jgi:carboxyl-terminal processing protease